MAISALKQLNAKRESQFWREHSKQKSFPVLHNIQSRGDIVIVQQGASLHQPYNKYKPVNPQCCDQKATKVELLRFLGPYSVVSFLQTTTISSNRKSKTERMTDYLFSYLCRLSISPANSHRMPTSNLLIFYYQIELSSLFTVITY